VQKLLSKFFKGLNWFQTAFGHRLRVIPGALSIAMFIYRLMARFLPKVITVRGSKMYTNPHEATFFLTAAFDPESYYEGIDKIFEKVIKKGDTIVDMGANIGFYTLLAANLVGEKGKVYSFEPDPKTNILLKMNVELNNYHNVVIIQKAVSNQTGTAKFYLSTEPGADTLYRESSGKYIEIETETLDHYFQDKDQTIDVIKMDVEGAEIAALSGMDKILRQNNNLKMFLEFVPRNVKRAGYTTDIFFNNFSSYGFKIYFPDSGKLRHITDTDELLRLCGNKVCINLFLTRQVLDMDII
jgi:FkbM family methyltransferase